MRIDKRQRWEQLSDHKQKRRPEPGGTRNHKQMFLIVGHLATPLSDAAFPSAALRSS
jgi:hypothetical protein